MKKRVERKKRNSLKKYGYFSGKYGLFFLISFIVLILPIVLYFSYVFYFDDLKKEVTLEIGTEFVLLEYFFKDGKVPSHTSFITDVSSIDTTKVGNYEIEIEEQNKRRKTKLKFVDTTPPKVTFQDLERYVDYEFNANDFVVEKTDLSSMEVTVENIPDFSRFGDYPVLIKVYDASRNVTSKECILHIGVIHSEYVMELGTKLKKEDLLYNPKDINAISDSEINRINQSPVGEYILTAKINGQEFTSKIKIQDTLPPELTLKNVTIYNDVTSITKEDFIVSVQDASNEVTTSLLTTIDFHKLGTQEIVIEARDSYDNKVTKKTTVTIVEDKTPPVIYGVSTLSVAKNSTISYLNGVSARDAKDGVVSVSVDSSRVNTKVAGTYYATYTAIDKAGNKTRVSRKIIVNHDASDVAQKVKEHADKVGSSVLEINEYVKKNIHYSDSWGDDDPVWYGLTNYRGNCYVHAMVFQAILKQKGYETQLIWTTDRTHYWNLVKINGVWRHSDSTPGTKQAGIILATDEERIAMLQGRDWDHSLWPEAK